MSEHTGGTVTYHRAEWMDGMWAVTFLEDGPRRWLTPAEGEAMGLTVPEPAPLVVTCNGHSVELSDEQARLFVESWAKYDARHEWDKSDGPRVSASLALAGLLRDARQAPQPTVDTPSDDDELPFMSPRQCLEALLAGRDDADEMLSRPRTWSAVWMDVVADAARGGA